MLSKTATIAKITAVPVLSCGLLAGAVVGPAGLRTPAPS